MRLAALGAIALLAASMAACAPYTAEPYATPVDPEQAAERAAGGALIGAAIGAGIGAMAAPNPPVGAIAGAEIGSGIGAVLGVVTTSPPPTYTPIPVPAEAVIPHFYDNWPPGYHVPPDNSETLSPHES